MDLTDIDWPAFGLDDDVRPLLQTLIERGQTAVLATLSAAEGGSPRGVGAQMLFGEDAVTGYLSGGCIEADVALHARAVMADGAPRRLVYGRGGPADIRLPCGGRIEVLVERLATDDPAARRLIALTGRRTPALWLTDGTERACLAPREAPDGLPPALQTAFRAARDGGVCRAAGQALFRRFDPKPRLIVIGADPAALAMASLGFQVGFSTTLVRPKGPIAQPPVPVTAYLRGDPARALAASGLDPWTSIAVATHDPDLDDPALAAALPSAAGYVGVLGSKRRLPERLQRLRALGVAEADLRRLKAPIGLALAGKSPWEIAVSVIGEVVQTARSREETDVWPAPVADGLHALVFAAGQGARYGGAKLLAPWRGGRLLDGALAAAFAAPVRTVILVTGAHAGEVGDAARTFAAGHGLQDRLRIVHAADHAQGLSASIRAGVAALPAEAQGAFLFLADMPRPPHAMFRPLAGALAAGAKAAAPRFAGRRGHPVLVSRELFGKLLALEGDRGAGALLQDLGADLVLIDAPDDGVLFDVDEPGDLQADARPIQAAPAAL